MTTFANRRDRRVYETALAQSPTHHVIGNVRRCQFDARVDFAPSEDGPVGALVTENRDDVRVSYFNSDQSLNMAWIDTLQAHAECCLYLGTAA